MRLFQGNIPFVESIRANRSYFFWTTKPFAFGSNLFGNFSICSFGDLDWFRTVEATWKLLQLELRIMR